ncbi:DUF6044 family protein [Bacillus sp. Marseille-P3661]|uniref:DUF6044 family protein n=1 Tax=Bacillus sp. Marseille-P3661 TaxID=1936234 RepID=UPI000C82E8E8|nr:DUF6044 family protein [Bacillus sp. Marseille-P3661]
MSISLLKKRENIYLLFSFIIIGIFVSPLFILGENAHIRVHDNLDSNIAWYKVLANSGELFGSLNSTITQVINGLPRNAYGPELSGIVMLHALLPSMTAYAISQTITRILAFIGMYLLLKAHFIKGEDASVIRIGVALLFALTPFWPSGMLSTLGHPLALWAFLNIRARQHTWREWLTLGLLPLYSSIVLGFFFFLVGIGLLWLRDVIIKKDWNGVFLGSLIFMAIMFLVVDYRLVFSFLIPHEATHRSEFISSRHDFWHSIRLSLKNFAVGHTHVMTLHTAVILPTWFLALILMFYFKKIKHEKMFVFLMILNYGLSLWYAFWFNTAWIPLKERIDLLNTFNFARFHFLRPLVIYLSFAIACYFVWRLGKKWRIIVYAALLLQLFVLIPYNEEIRYRSVNAPSFKEFYAVDQFENIEEFIGKPQESYRVASIGLHPAIAQYNGFYTLDTYNNFYPITYKYKFREIIENELAKNKKLKRYYDEWGSRCYIFVDELGKKYDFRKNSKKQINNLELNTAAFKEMGGRYIFAAVPILNANENDLELLKVFEDDISAWKVYLYRAI